MTGITNPAQEYFKDGLWGWVTDQWKKLIGDAAGHLQVDVVESGLPTGAATSANQTTMITALQLIDDLRAALTTVATDSLDVRLDGQTADVEVKQQTAADLTPGVMGWDGSAWRKLPMLWGFTETVADRQFDTDADAGTNDLTFTAPAGGEVWVITNVAFRNRGSVCSSIVVTAYVAGATPPLVVEYSPVANQWDTHAIHCVLEYGDSLMIRFNDCTALDYIEAQMIGYSMSVAE